MAISMAKTIKEERLRWVLPIGQGKIRLIDAVKVCPHSKRSLERWLAAYRQLGEIGLEPKSTAPKSNPKETPIRVKERIKEIRKQKDECALKIKWDLEDEGVAIHERTVGKILKRENLVRKYRTARLKCKYIKAERQPGDLVEIDVKYVPGAINGLKHYQYTAIDCASRWRHLAAYDDESSFYSIQFLKETIRLFPHPIKAIKTDNHAIFTNWANSFYKRSDRTLKRLHDLDIFCSRMGITHYLIDPGKPSQNGTVERSHRTDQEKFYDKNGFKSFEDLKIKLICWNMKYNNTKHCGLNGKTPNQILVENH
jgi:transposase InsO family protein